MNVFTLNCFDEEFNDPKESLILSSCGHPCLRVWVGGFRPDLAMDNFCEVRGQTLRRRGNPVGRARSLAETQPFTAVAFRVLLFIGICNLVDFGFCFGCRVFGHFLILQTMDVDGDISCDDPCDLRGFGDVGTHLRRLLRSSQDLQN